MRHLVVPALLLTLACTPAPAPDDAGHVPPDPPDAALPPCDPLPTGVTVGQHGHDGGPLATPTRRVVLMGGSAEVDDASRTFVEGAGGGAVLALRATGSVESYTAYFSTELGPTPPPSSVTTLRLDDPETSSHPSLACQVQRAHAVWLAGGDQWNYVGLWQQPLPGAIHALHAQGATVGGTSAGAMALGGWVFTAREGSVTSEEALLAPTHSSVHVIPSPMAQPELDDTVVDTHFSQRAREGRLLAFAAHMLHATGHPVHALGLDEETAITVEDGQYLVQGNGAAWWYRITGPVDVLEDAHPLSLQGITRVRLDPGAAGAWPPSTDQGTLLHVVDGTVQAP